MTSILVAGLVTVLIAGLVAVLVAGLIARASVLLRHVLSAGGVATACSCRDLFLLKLTSRQLIDVTTFWSVQLLSGHPDVVATSSLIKCYRDNQVLSRPLLSANVVATTRCCRDLFSHQMLSRQPGVVATSSLSKCCRDNQVLSRPLLSANVVATTFSI